MANKSLSTPTLKEDEDTLATREALSSEELQGRLEKIIKMLSVVNNKDISDFGSLEGEQELPPYDPLDKSTYTSRRPQFLRYQPSRKDDDEQPLKKYEGMERSQRPPCSKIVILLLVAALFVLIVCISVIVCISALHSSKLYANLNLQTLNGYPNGFGQPISENSDELELPTNEYADELGLLIREDSEESGLRINVSMSIDGDETHGLAVLKQFGTTKFESTYNFAAHSTVLIGLSVTLVLESPYHMEGVMSEEKKAKEWVLDVLVVGDSKHLGILDVLVVEDSKQLGLLDVLVADDSQHLGVLDVLVAEDSKHLGAVLSSTSVKSLRSALLCAVTGAFFCAAAVVINLYKKRAIYVSPKTSLKSVKEIQTKTNNRTQQGSLTQLSKMQTKCSSVPSVQLINEYSPAQAVRSSSKKKDNMWNDSSIRENSFYISNLEIRRKGNSASTTNQENMISGEVYMENSSYGSLTTMAKDKDKKQQKVMPVRKSDLIRNPTKSDCSLYKQDIDIKQLKAIPLRRSDRIRNLAKSDCARRQHA